MSSSSSTTPAPAPLVRSRSQPSLSTAASSAPSTSSTLVHPSPRPLPPPPPSELDPIPSSSQSSTPRATRPRSSSRSTKAAQYPPVPTKSHRDRPRSSSRPPVYHASLPHGHGHSSRSHRHHPYSLPHHVAQSSGGYDSPSEDGYPAGHSRTSSASSIFVPLTFGSSSQSHHSKSAKRSRLRTAITVLLVFVGLVLLGTILVLGMVQSYFGVWEVDVIRPEEVQRELLRLQGGSGALDAGSVGAYGGHWDGPKSAAKTMERTSIAAEIVAEAMRTREALDDSTVASLVKRGWRLFARRAPPPASTLLPASPSNSSSASSSGLGGLAGAAAALNSGSTSASDAKRPGAALDAAIALDGATTLLPIVDSPEIAPSEAGAEADPDLVIDDTLVNTSRWQQLVDASLGIDGEPIWPTTPALRDGERIPRFIHQTWKTAELPERWGTVRRECEEMMPDYEYFLWTDSLSRSFIAQFYPWFLPTFESYPYNIQRADAIRYFVLYHFGGVYLDLDVGCRRRLDPLLAFPAILPRTIPVGVSNDLMFSEQGSKFMDYVIHNLVTFDLNLFTNYPTVMFSTGPMFISLQYNLWPLRAPSSSAVRILPKIFYGKNAKPAESTQSFFYHYYGSSWHDGDAGFIVWLGRSGKAILWIGMTLVLLGALRLGWSKLASAWRASARGGARYVQLGSGASGRRGSMAYSESGTSIGTPSLPLSRPSSPGPRLASRSRTPVPFSSHHSPSNGNSGFWFFLPASLFPSSSSSPNANVASPTSPRGWASFLPPFPSYAGAVHPTSHYTRVPHAPESDEEESSADESNGYRLRSVRTEAPPLPEKREPAPPPKYERWASAVNGTSTLIPPSGSGFSSINGGLSVVSSATASPAVGMGLALTRTPSPRLPAAEPVRHGHGHAREWTSGTDDSSTYDDAEMDLYQDATGYEAESAYHTGGSASASASVSGTATDVEEESGKARPSGEWDRGSEWGEGTDEERGRDGDVDLEGFGTTPNATSTGVERLGRARVEDEVDRLLSEMAPDVNRR